MDFLTELLYLFTLKYKKYFCGEKICLAPKSLASSSCRLIIVSP